MIPQKKLLFAFGAFVLLGAGLALSQSKQAAPQGPRLYRMWSDAKGDTHLEEISLATRGRVTIPGLVMNFSGNPAPEGGEKLHNTGSRQFAVTVYGELDVEASDGTKAHLRTGDMSFVEDLTGKGHRTMEKGSQTIFLRVPDNFDVKKWAAGQP